MDTSEVSISSDIKSDVDSDRELIPELESIKGSQSGSVKGPLLGPGRGSSDPVKGSSDSKRALPEKPDPNNPSDNPAVNSQEDSTLSEKSAVSKAEHQGIKPSRDNSEPHSVKEVMSPNPSQRVMGDGSQAMEFEKRFEKLENIILHMQQVIVMQGEDAVNAPSQHEMSAPSTPLRGESANQQGNENRPCWTSSPLRSQGGNQRSQFDASYPPLPPPPGTPVNGDSSQKAFGPSLSEQWKTKPQGVNPNGLGTDREEPFQGVNHEAFDDRACVVDSSTFAGVRVFGKRV